MNCLHASALLLVSVFGVINTADGVLQWGQWSACSVTCGYGTKTRTCHPASSCPDTEQYKETQPCINKICRNKFRFFDSLRCNVWSECSASCGGGIQTMTQCFRGNTRRKTCNVQKCPSDLKKETDEGECPLEGIPIKYRPTENVCCKPSGYGSQCGKINNQNRKKMAASPAVRFIWDDSEQLFPWSVVVKVDGKRCGGVMISKTHVLTAASCVSLVKQPSSVSVLRAAAHKWYQNYAGDRKTVKSIIPHPDFVRQIEYDNNVAILELAESFEDQPTCLPRGEEIAVGSTCVLADFEQATPFYLTHISNDFSIADFSTCEQYYQRYSFSYLNANQLLNKDKMLCGWRTSSAANQPRNCKGTTGAPLLCQRCSTCQWVLQGIVSYSDDSCYPINRPAIFTKVSTFENWVTQTVDLGYVDNTPICS